MPQIVDLRPSIQPISVQFIVLEGGPIRAFEGGNPVDKQRAIVLVADLSASVHFLVNLEELEVLAPGGIFKLTNGIFCADKNEPPYLRIGKKGILEKVGEFSLLFAENPNMSQISWVSDPKTHIWKPQAPEKLPSKFWQPPVSEKKH